MMVIHAFVFGLYVFMRARQASVNSTGDTFFARIRSDACLSVSAARSAEGSAARAATTAPAPAIRKSRRLTTGLLRSGFGENRDLCIRLQRRLTFVPLSGFLISVRQREYSHFAEARTTNLKADRHAVL